MSDQVEIDNILKKKEDLRVQNIMKYDMASFHEIDNIYMMIDTLSSDELDMIIKYAEEQKQISDLVEKRRKQFSNQLRIERIKYKKELNNIRAIQDGDSFDEECEVPAIPRKKINKRRSKKI